MAVFDGGPSELSVAAIENHIASFATCGEDIEQLKSLATWLSQQERREQTVDLWPVIRHELDQREGAKRSPDWRTFLLLTVLLPAYRLVEIVPRIEMSAFIKLIPVLVVIGIFGYLRENPFKINASLTLEGE